MINELYNLYLYLPFDGLFCYVFFRARLCCFLVQSLRAKFTVMQLARHLSSYITTFKNYLKKHVCLSFLLIGLCDMHLILLIKCVVCSFLFKHDLNP